MLTGVPCQAGWLGGELRLAVRSSMYICMYIYVYIYIYTLL